MKNLNNGAFFLTRKIFTSEIWLEKPCSWAVIWIYILGNVNYKKNGKYDRGEGFFNFSKELKNIGLDITYDMIRSFLKYAKMASMLTTMRTTRGTIVKVLKYNEYQTLESYSTTTENTNQTASQPQQNLNDTEESKEIKNIYADLESADTSSTLNKIIGQDDVNTGSDIFNSKEYLLWSLKTDKRNHVKMVMWYLLWQEQEFSSKEQVSYAIARHSKVAKELLIYDPEKINKVARYLDKQKEEGNKWLQKWTIETILKYINQPDIYEN